MFDDLNDVAPAETEEERRRREAQQMFGMKPPDASRVAMMDAMGNAPQPAMPQRLQGLLPPALQQQSPPDDILTRMFGDLPRGGASAAAPGAGPETAPRTLGPQPAPAYYPMVPPIGGSLQDSGAVKIFDGFHGDEGLGPMTGTPTYGPSIAAGPGAGWGTNAHPSDQEYANRAGQALVPHVWTEGDLDPTRVLGVNGFKFSPDTQGYTAGSPNLPLFAAAQARAKQDNLLNQMFLQHQNETQHMLAQQMFQAGQNDLNRKSQVDIANIAAGKTDHTRLNDQATNPAAPLSERNTSIDEGEKKGLFTPERASEMRTLAIVDQAKKIDPNRGSKFWSYVQQNFNPQTMRKDSLIPGGAE
jgi:hypothetical protein